MRRLLALAALYAALTFAATAQAAPGDPPSAACTDPNGQPVNCGDWHRFAVTLTWTYDQMDTTHDGCVDLTQVDDSVDSSGTEYSCKVDWTTADPPVSAETKVKLFVDATPPVISDTVFVRAWDYDGWYNHPVLFGFDGTDQASGGVSCPGVTYSTPEGEGQEVIAECTDAAGNTARRSFPLNYDATPPSVSGVKADAGDRSVTLSWVASADTKSVDVVRSAPGEPDQAVAGATDVGGPGVLVDTGLTNGVTYTYTVRAHDRADNVASASDSAQPRAATAGNTQVATKVFSPPSIKWRKAKKARYYNVQLYRGRVKLLSLWPRTTTLQLSQSWTYAGKRRQLAPGTYKWYVWPGYGKRKAAHYGKLLAKGTFKVAG